MKYFELYEIVDRATYQQWGENAWTLFSPLLLDALDGVREFFNAPVTVNNWFNNGPFQYRGYRGPECHIGAKNSYHKKGMAADFDVQGYSAEEARKIIKENQDNPLLANIMRMEADVTWVHMDVAPAPSGKKRIYIFKG